MYRQHEQISVGERFTVSRARRASDGRAVVLKSVRADRRDPRSDALLRHEWKVLRGLDFAGVARALDCEEGELGPTLVLEDAGPGDLAALLLSGKPLDAGRFLELAISMAGTLGEVHRRGIIHRDVCPMNFVLGERPTLVDFETATTARVFADVPGVPSELDGTLAYIAPEQTGRMSRRVDHRADLYALGATFYQMLTGTPPFTTCDPLELLHAHVAKMPHTPSVVNAGVPIALSNIVVKLLAKMPEWRYQTAEALQADLVEARRRARPDGEIPTFELGRQDIPFGLLLGGTLYGREDQERELVQAIGRARAGHPSIVLVSGPAGVGKSALVQRARDVAGAGCLWAEGKGDMLAGNVPYAAVLEALRGLARSALRREAGQVLALQARIRTAVGSNGRILTDTFPDLAPLLGDRPPAGDVGPIEAENRLQRALVAFLHALAEEGTPLVLFLDDLQWADPGSLKLLAAIGSAPDPRWTLIIGGYRSEDVGPDHALWRATERIRAAGTPITRLELRPLERQHVEALLCDALRVDPRRARPLADEIWKKTAGNPFFIRRFLGYLCRAGLLFHDAGSGRWSWDIARIGGAEITENVVDLLSRSIRMLPAREQALLKTAACVGNEVDLGLLAGLSGETVADVARVLWTPIQEGFLVPAAGGPRFPWAAVAPVELGTASPPVYRFVHDRVQEAAYQLLGEAERQRAHLHIGRWLLANVPAGALDDALCAIVDQLDRAADCLDGEERADLALQNHGAGRVARAAAAYASALCYFRTGLDLLPPSPWQSRWHDTWFALARDAAECAALTGDHTLCRQICEDAIARTGARLEKAALQHVLAQSSALRGAHAEAIRSGREGLRLLGIDLPAEVSGELVRAERERTREALAPLSDRQILLSGPMHDPEEREQLRHLISLAAATWFTAPDLYQLVCFRAVDLTARRGLAEGSPFAFAAYAIALVMDGDHEGADRFGRLAVKLARQAADQAQECRTLMVLGGHVSGWREPVRASIPLLRRSYCCGLEAGEFEYASYSAANLIWALWISGAGLDDVLAESDRALALYRRIGHLSGISYVTPVVQAARCLKGLTRDCTSFDDAAFEEARFLVDAAESGLGQAAFHLFRLMTCLLLDQPALALEYVHRGERWMPYLRTLYLQVDWCFYSALALARQSEPAPPERESRLAELWGHLSRLESWARWSPAGAGHKRDLVAAEIARIEGRPGAMELHERAIAAAGREGYVQDEALGNELCARLFRARGDEQAAEQRYRAAIEGFARWGASAVVARLAAECPGAAASAQCTTAAPGGLDARLTLDMHLLLRAAEALSAELVMDRLLQKMMRVCIEAASAERAALVLVEEGLVLRAMATAAGEVSLVRTPVEDGAGIPRSIVEHTFRSGETLVLGDASRDARFADDPSVAQAGVRSVLAVPLRKKGRTVGILYFENNLATLAFTPERVEVFQLLSAQMAVAIENSLLFEERRRAEEAQRLLSEAAAALSESLEIDEVLATIRGLVVPRLADFCLVDVMEGGALRPAGELHVDPRRQALVEALHRVAPADVDSPQPQAAVLRSREPLLVPDVTEDFLRARTRDAAHLRAIQALEPRSLMVLPLVAHGRGIGVLTLVRSSEDQRYGAADLSIAELLARRVALALDNARLHRDLREEMRLRATNERRLAEAQRVAHVGSFEWDVGPNTVTWSDELHRIYGIEPGQFEGTFEGFLARVHPEDLELTRNTICEAFRRRSAFVYDHRVIRADGKARILHTRGDVIADESGEPVRVVGTCWDVTELSEAIAERERALRARDELLSIAAHEIRGPITSLHLAAQLLGAGMLSEAAQRRALDIIEREDRRLGRFVDELLDLSRIRTGTFSFDLEDVDLAEVVRQVAARLGPELGKAGSSLSLSIPGPVHGEWDRLRLDQLVTNLLSNALKFGLGKPIDITLSARDGTATLVMRDQGMGIAPDLVPRLFEPFERGVSVRNYGGLGLGLYLVQAIAEGMGGEVSVQSTLGAGSTFTVKLPQARRR